MNEKLGAEQGRGTLQAIAQEIVANLGSCDASSDLGFKVIWATLNRHFGTGPKQTEQAYHARGAGREERKFEEVLELHVNSSESMRETYRRTANSDMENFQEGFTEGVRRAIEVYGNWRIAREPGADTGTTPQGGGRSPNDTSPMYSDDVIAAIRQQKQSTAAERGTTPPEGLRAALEQVLSEGHCNDTCSSQLVETCTCDCWKAKVHAALAATQRAPVEQGRDELQELKLSSEGERSGSSHPVTIGSSPSPASADHARGTGREPRDAQDYVERFFGPAVEFIQQNGYADWDGSANGQTITLTGCANMIAHWKRGELAPDHAREGATIKCPKCGIDVFAHGETCPVSREGALLKLGAKLDKIISQAALDAKLDLWMRQQVNAALDGLADGKEGGE